MENITEGLAFQLNKNASRGARTCLVPYKRHKADKASIDGRSVGGDLDGKASVEVRHQVHRLWPGIAFRVTCEGLQASTTLQLTC